MSAISPIKHLRLFDNRLLMAWPGLNMGFNFALPWSQQERRLTEHYKGCLTKGFDKAIGKEWVTSLLTEPER